jgi:hypothetical protein
MIEESGTTMGSETVTTAPYCGGSARGDCRNLEPFRVFLVAAMCTLVLGGPAKASSAQDAVEAVTASGDRVHLYPNGRWEYDDPRKAADARRIADRFPENHPRAQVQGGWLGTREIVPGDPDYNRGTLNPKLR